MWEKWQKKNSGGSASEWQKKAEMPEIVRFWRWHFNYGQIRSVPSQGQYRPIPHDPAMNIWLIVAWENGTWTHSWFESYSFASSGNMNYFICVSFIQTFIHSFVRSFVRSFVHSFIRSFVFRDMNSKLIPRWLIHSFDSFIWKLIRYRIIQRVARRKICLFQVLANLPRSKIPMAPSRRPS